MDSFAVRIDGLQFAPAALAKRQQLWGMAVRELAGPDGKLHVLVQLADSFVYWRGFRPLRVRHLLAVPRWDGDSIGAAAYNVAVEISLVLDPTLEQAEIFRAEQVEYVAVGSVTRWAR